MSLSAYIVIFFIIFLFVHLFSIVRVSRNTRVLKGENFSSLLVKTVEVMKARYKRKYFWAKIALVAFYFALAMTVSTAAIMLSEDLTVLFFEHHFNQHGAFIYNTVFLEYTLPLLLVYTLILLFKRESHRMLKITVIAAILSYFLLEGLVNPIAATAELKIYSPVSSYLASIMKGFEEQTLTILYPVLLYTNRGLIFFAMLLTSKTLSDFSIREVVKTVPEKKTT